jgi:hypothetical protein
MEDNIDGKDNIDSVHQKLKNQILSKHQNGRTMSLLFGLKFVELVRIKPKIQIFRFF